MKICLAQIQAVKGNIEANIICHQKWIDLAISNKADLIVFPELSITGYQPKLTRELATNQDDHRFDIFQLISNVNNITIAIGAPIKSSAGVLISMLIFQANKPRTSYAKQELHTDEFRYFVQGNSPLMITINNRTIAPAICYESLQHSHSEKAHKLGADIYIATVAKPKEGIDKALQHFPKIAAKYSMPVLMVNFIGESETFKNFGNTSVWDDKGVLIGQLNSSTENILLYDTIRKEIVVIP